MTSWVKLSKLLGAVSCAPKIRGRKSKLLVSYGTCVILPGLAVRHSRRSVRLSPVSAVVREETSPAPRTRRCSGIAWYSDFVFPIVFVLAALMVVAAGSLGLLVRTLKYVQKKFSFFFSSFFSFFFFSFFSFFFLRRSAPAGGDWGDASPSASRKRLPEASFLEKNIENVRKSLSY